MSFYQRVLQPYNFTRLETIHAVRMLNAALGVVLGLSAVALPARLTSLPLVGEVLNHPSPRAAKFMVQQCIYDPEPYIKSA